MLVTRPSSVFVSVRFFPGPLVTEEDDHFVLIGVTPWGVGCATLGYPGVYARLTKVLPWIHKQLKGSTCFDESK